VNLYVQFHPHFLQQKLHFTSFLTAAQSSTVVAYHDLGDTADWGVLFVLAGVEMWRIQGQSFTLKSFQPSGTLSVSS